MNCGSRSGRGVYIGGWEHTRQGGTGLTRLLLPVGKPGNGKGTTFADLEYVHWNFHLKPLITVFLDCNMLGCNVVYMFHPFSAYAIQRGYYERGKQYVRMISALNSVGTHTFRALATAVYRDSARVETRLSHVLSLCACI